MKKLKYILIIVIGLGFISCGKNYRIDKKYLDALYWMYIQYCSDGHQFMNAGEDASYILEEAKDESKLLECPQRNSRTHQCVFRSSA